MSCLEMQKNVLKKFRVKKTQKNCIKKIPR